MTTGTRQAIGAACFYLVVTCAITWPLLTVITKELVSDMGDPVLNAWILLWTSGQVVAFFSGDTAALSQYWHGNIFHPEPLTIAYSEHLTAQMVQALPVLVSTENVILAYNLVVISTFVLSGLGTFLLVRDLTGRPLAALVAGLAFAFAPYRFDQLSHIQVLSAQWMPFVLFGFRRYFDTGRRRALAGGSTALVLQNLSCGYYALFFAPFVVAYVVYELAARRRLRDFAAWRAFALAGLAVSLGTLPFLTPYVAVRDLGGVGVRSFGEIAMFSADAHAFATATSRLWLWGDYMRAFPRGEGQAFLGLTILVLAAAGVAAGIMRTTRVPRVPAPAWRQVLVGALAALLAAFLYALASVLVTGRFAISAGGVWMVWAQANRVIAGTLLISAALVLLVRRAKVRDTAPAWPWTFYAVAAVSAAVLAMGPNITVRSAVVAPGPYAWLMDYAPGFDGLRVPSRYIMLVTLFLAVLAGFGAAHLLARAKRAGTALVIAAAAFILVESWPGKFPLSEPLGTEDLAITSRELPIGKRLPPLYKTIRDLNSPVVLLELPFGSPAWDLRAVFYAGYHRKPLVNGYSGFFPNNNQALQRELNLRLRDPQTAWRALLGSGATHVLVHEGAFLEPRQQEVSGWLRAMGAQEVLVDGTDRLFTVR